MLKGVLDCSVGPIKPFLRSKLGFFTSLSVLLFHINNIKYYIYFVLINNITFINIRNVLFTTFGRGFLHRLRDRTRVEYDRRMIDCGQIINQNLPSF